MTPTFRRPLFWWILGAVFVFAVLSALAQGAGLAFTLLFGLGMGVCGILPASLVPEGDAAGQRRAKIVLFCLMTLAVPAAVAIRALG